MPIEKIDTELLSALGINTSAQQAKFRLAYEQTSIAEINHELEELGVLKKLAQRKTLQIVQTLGETLAEPDNPFTASWGKYTNGYQMSAKIADDPRSIKVDKDGKPYFSYAGREIKTYLQGSRSNTDFNPDHIHDIFDSIYIAARDLAPTERLKHNKYLREVEALHAEFLDKTSYLKPSKKYLKMPSMRSVQESSKEVVSDVDEEAFIEDIESTMPAGLTEDSITKIMADFAKQTGSKKIEHEKLKSIISRCIYIHKMYIGRLAIALWRAENNSTDIPSVNEYYKYVKKIQERDIKNVSSKPRPILVNIYRQDTFSINPFLSHYVIVTQVPNSDISSALRSLEDMMFSNDWSITVETIDVRHDPRSNAVSYENYKKFTSFKRSSSIARITYEQSVDVISGKKKLSDLVDNKELDHVYKAFCKLVIQYAREQLIEKINSGEDISNILKTNKLLIRENYITLLSGLISKEAGKKYTSFMPSFVTTKTIHENEAAQLATTRHCLDTIELDPTLIFSEEDTKEIMRRTEKARKAHKLDITEDSLRLNIEHRNWYSNYMVNALGPMRMERLDLFNANWKYFVAGNKKRARQIVEYLQTTEELDQYPFLKMELIKIFLKIATGDKERIRDLLTDKLGQDFKTDLAACPNLNEIIKLYVDIEAYFDKSTHMAAEMLRASARLASKASEALGSSTREQNEQTRIADSYLTAAKDERLAEILDSTSHVTCKSGVDRTGQFASIIEALACTDPDADFSGNILNSLKHGPNIITKTINLSGIAGWQIPANTLTGMIDPSGGDPKKIAEFISQGMLVKIGQMGKEIYKHDSAVYEAVTNTVQQQDKILISSSRRQATFTAPTPTAPIASQPAPFVFSPNPKPILKKSTVPLPASPPGHRLKPPAKQEPSIGPVKPTYEETLKATKEGLKKTSPSTISKHSSKPGDTKT